MEVKIPPKVTPNAFKKILAIGGKKCLRVAVEGGFQDFNTKSVWIVISRMMT